MRLSSLVSAIAVVSALTADAQVNTTDRIETILIPVATNGEVPGAFGSLWLSEVWARNGTTLDLEFQEPCRFPGCEPDLKGGQIAMVSGFQGPEGMLLFNAVEAASNGEFPRSSVTIEARLFELSRYAQPNGIEIPVVREADFLSDPVWLLGIRPSTANRVAIRVWDPGHVESASVLVEVYDRSGTERIVAFELPLAGRMFGDPPQTQRSLPAIGSVLNLQSSYPEILNEEVVHIRISPQTDDLLYYAMASITDNETQHVTIVSP